MNYNEFLESKKKNIVESGFDCKPSNPNLFDFQRYLVKKALKKGRYAIFADTGLGKTIMQLSWSEEVCKYENKPVIIFAPLAVSGQTIAEGKKFGIEVEKYDNQKELKPIPYIVNYEQIDNVNKNDFIGITLDESSILKNHVGKYRNKFIEIYGDYKYKTAWTATPSPNDELEIGNHSEFLNVLSSQDMRSFYFTTNKSRNEGNKYRLKKHAIKDFYSWIGEWSTVLTNPSDIGFVNESSKYNLPQLNHIELPVKISMIAEKDTLFKETSVSATQFNKELNNTINERVEVIKKLVCDTKRDEAFLIWVHTNNEADAIKKAIPEAKEVRGSDKTEYKEKTLLGFANNEFRVLITKPKIAQYGLNFQYVKNPNMIFASLDFSFESTYQATRRMHRFGQTKDVNVYYVTLPTMANVVKTINEKEQKFINMRNGMIKLFNQNNKGKNMIQKKENTINTDWYNIVNTDCIEYLKTVENNSLDFSFFSPPFANMYVFSNSMKDMSNTNSYNEFLNHHEYLVPLLKDKIRKGRMVAIHMTQFTTLVGKDGYYSIVDFRGDLIRQFEKHGFILHGEVVIPKDPKPVAVRTKNHQLMYGTTKKNSLTVRAGLNDYILIFRNGKEIDNERPVKPNLAFETWTSWAWGVWGDIKESDTLSVKNARANNDEKHLTPTQLEPIRRLIKLYTNENETVFCPFAGIGSEGYVAIEQGRKFIGIELKESYFNEMKKNLDAAISLYRNQKRMF